MSLFLLSPDGSTTHSDTDVWIDTRTGMGSSRSDQIAWIHTSFDVIGIRECSGGVRLTNLLFVVLVLECVGKRCKQPTELAWPRINGMQWDWELH